MSFLERHPTSSALLGAVILILAAQGCGGDGDSNAKPPEVGNGGTKITGGSGNKAGSTNGGTPGSGGSSNGGSPEGGEPTNGGKGGSTNNEAGTGNVGGEPPIPECDLPETGADGCFNCPNDGDVTQWLNRCSDSDCVPFNNKARLPLLKADGSVPALPK